MHVSIILSKFIRAAAIFALLTGAAFAQLPMPGMTLSPDKPRTLTPEEKEKQKAIDEQYKEMMKKIPDKRRLPILGATFAPLPPSHPSNGSSDAAALADRS
jgi:hypothetical protein